MLALSYSSEVLVSLQKYLITTVPSCTEGVVASASGAAAHLAMGHPDLLPALYLSAGAAAGGLAGALLSRGIGEGPLRWAVAASVFAAAASMALLRP